ncbi:hypothetical protein VSA01S_27840 [Vibrio sagamiensis NBRC 104589]|uniref:Uncharacterized protein n=1 Tax=Vibrio sagamiensis NBRC 104589 TaxID=1219064 RepID=A0A511QJN3_9VIBR|nr:hypothetical protein VSA01S_27840 [Vibrio sagamiensis NBRC 104589]
MRRQYVSFPKDKEFKLKLFKKLFKKSNNFKKPKRQFYYYFVYDYLFQNNYSKVNALFLSHPMAINKNTYTLMH